MAYVGSEIQMQSENVHENNRKINGIRHMRLVFIVGLLIWGWLEIIAFIFVSNEVGGLLTFLGVFLTAIVGIAFLKNQGLSVLNRVRSDLAKGRPPVASIADSVSLVFGGGLMLIPGYVTDSVGLILFIPGFRTIAGIYLLKWIAKKPSFTGFVNFSGSAFTQENSNPDLSGFSEHPRHQNDFDEVIEGEFEELPDAESYINHKKKDLHND